ncbi:hypothetical protein HN51_058798, partial [Arachis hypogaea]
FYIVSYSLGIYMLNLLIASFTLRLIPKFKNSTTVPLSPPRAPMSSIPSFAASMSSSSGIQSRLV